MVRELADQGMRQSHPKSNSPPRVYLLQSQKTQKYSSRKEQPTRTAPPHQACNWCFRLGVHRDPLIWQFRGSPQKSIGISDSAGPPVRVRTVPYIDLKQISPFGLHRASPRSARFLHEGSHLDEANDPPLINWIARAQQPSSRYAL